MKELFSLLDEREKSQLRWLGLLLIAGLLFLSVFALGQRRSFFSLKDRLLARQKVLTEIEAKRTKRAEEWAKWQGSYHDLEELKKTYFYQKEDDHNQLRLDLEKIMDEAGVSAKFFKYDYSSPGKEMAAKVSISFTFVGSYALLKRFLQTLEQFPKFLMLEKIDFARISGEENTLELRIVLAGYYGSY